MYVGEGTSKGVLCRGSGKSVMVSSSQGVCLCLARVSSRRQLGFLQRPAVFGCNVGWRSNGELQLCLLGLWSVLQPLHLLRVSESFVACSLKGGDQWWARRGLRLIWQECGPHSSSSACGGMLGGVVGSHVWSCTVLKVFLGHMC